MPRISAIICTHNGAKLLRKALESLARQTLAREDFEIIVVDNASSDATPQVVEEMRREHANLYYRREDRLGLSWARNTGAEIASSPYLAYLDDDARAEPQWMESLLAAFEACIPAPDCVGGPVRLDWGGNAPSWLPTRYWRLYSSLDLGDAGHFLREREYLVGANIAFRRAALLDTGGFDVRLGRLGGMLLSGEESAVLGKLRKSGRPIFYEPKAAVWHFVQEKRRRRRWLRGRLFWDGASQPLLDYGTGQPRRFYASQAYRDLRRMARFGCEYVSALTHRDQERRTDSSLALAQRAGRLRTNVNLAVTGKS
jgi:glycosyltransferase involved in cell wall biosynthesis